LSAGPASTSSVGPASGSRLSDGELVVDRIEAFDDLAEVPARDVVLVAVNALGHPVSHGYVDGLLNITHRFPPYRTSMGLDVAAGRPTEVEVVVGRPVDAGMAAGVPMPVSRSLLRQLRTLTRTVAESREGR